MVFLEFLKSGKEIFYFKNQHECDFIIKEDSQPTPVQVSWDLHDKNTRERELKGLAEACNYLDTKSGIILCFDSEEEIFYNGLSIQVIPFYKHFLNL